MHEIREINLLCFHFAGGNKYSYPDFKSQNGLNFKFFELPGRGDRYEEKLLRNMEDALFDLFIQVKPHLNKPYAFFGHSMGSLISFLLTYLIREQGLTLPSHLFLSGRVPPSVTDEADRLYLLPKTDFWKGINDFGGVPAALLQYPDLMELYEPIIRADLQILDSYEHEEMDWLDIPFSIFHGTNEKLNAQNALQWQEYSTMALDIHKFEGDHFFILKHIESILAIFKQKLDIN